MSAIATTVNDLNDILVTTRQDFGPMQFTEISTDLQEHIAMSELMQENRVVPQGGKWVEWRVMVDHSQSARHVPLGASDDVDIPATMKEARADWRNSTVSYGMIGQELAMNSSAAMIIDAEQERRISSLISLASLMEGTFWGPPVASTDDITPWGINTWTQKNATEGFFGGMPTGYTTLGLSSTVYPRWRNWTGLYTDPTPTDLVRKLTKAATFTGFKTPISEVPELNGGRSQMGYYTNYGVIGPMEELLRAQNDNLGTGIDAYAGEVRFRRSPLRWVPYLEVDTTNPVYGINWTDYRLYILPGWWLRPTNLAHVPGYHTWSATHIDCTYQWVMVNRRRSFVLATATTYPG